MNTESIMERPYLRARRRVRQRVDAGEPRNSYSSIPGFSFRSMSSNCPSVSSAPPINAPHQHPFLAAAAAARMNGFPGPPGFGPPHPMVGPAGPFFRPPFPHPAPPNGDFHHPPGGHPPPMLPHPPPHFFGPHRPMLTPRQIFMMQQNSNFNSGNTTNSSPIHPHNNNNNNIHQNSNPSNNTSSSALQDFHQSVVGDIRAGMAAAACAAAAAVQRAQILIQAKTTAEATSTTLNGELTRKSPSKTEAEENHEGSKDEDGSGASTTTAAGTKDSCTPTPNTAADKDLNNASDSERLEGAPSSVEGDQNCGPPNDTTEEQPVVVDPLAPTTTTAATSNSAISSPSREPTISADEQSSLVESSSRESNVLVRQQQTSLNSNVVGINNNNNSTTTAPLLKEIIQGKLALAAAAALSRRHQEQDRHHQHHPNQIVSPYLIGPTHHLNQNTMEQTLATAAANFARHNNNDLKDHTSKNSVGTPDQMAFMSHLIKMRAQEMAMNMSMQQQQQLQHRNTSKPIVDSSDNEPTSPEEVKDEELDDDIDEDEELPIDLQRTSEDGASVQSQTSPRSPSSDAGMSTSSAGNDGKSKASRLEALVSNMQRGASPSLTKEGSKEAGNGGTVNGCKKRKLYQPVQAKSSDEGANSDETSTAPPDVKKLRDNESNEENIDPKVNGVGSTPPPTSIGSGTGVPFPPNSTNMVQMHYMEMARKFLQDQQDKATKEAITKEILADTVGKDTALRDKLISINPELKGLADVLKSEITASLALIIDSIVGRFLQVTRNNNASSAVRPPLAGMKTPFVGAPGVTGGLLEDSPIGGGPGSLLPPMPSLKTTVGGGVNMNSTTPSGRAPQVRDRAAPRSNHLGPVSMYNPMTKINPPTTSSASSTSAAFPLPPTLRPAPGLLQQAPGPHSNSSTPGGPQINNNNNNIHSEDEHQSSPSPVSRDLSPPEQDEALSLVVTPKKRRHKVTDTRITPRTLSRVLGEPLAELHKQFPHIASGFKAGGGPLGNHQNIGGDGHSPSRSVPGPHHPLFPGLPAPPGLLAGLPTSVAIPNPSLADFNPFSSFYSPPHLPNVSTSATPPNNSLNRNNPNKMGQSTPPPLEKSRPRERHHSSNDLGRENNTPPTMLRHPSLLSRGSPDFAARLREHRDQDMEEFIREQSLISGYGMGGEATSATLTPMHLRKAKLMFFWVRYPSSAILKMYFPDIKFNKNNTAQLVKWFSNFREFFYIQMEKYARQALSEGVKSDSELHVTEDAELYRVINVHYNRNNHIEGHTSGPSSLSKTLILAIESMGLRFNRNNHIEVPEHFLPVITIALREFFNSIQAGKDAESSWKKQIYKIIQRYDEPIPEYFKTPEFLKQLE